MKKNLLIVVDMQNDFISGALGNSDAQNMLPNMKEYIENFDGDVIFTKDTHFDDYLNTLEGNKLPIIHCKKNTWGWEIVDELKEIAIYNKIVEKPSFGSTKLMEYIKTYEEKISLESITLIGVCTDICVVSNAILLRSFFPNTKIFIKQDLCKGTSLENHENAINTMKCCHIDIL